VNTHFSENLRSLCAEHGSIAQVCRDIRINRQQFNRYLSGAGMPSAHNLRRISRHFGLNESDLFSDPETFNRHHIQNSAPKTRNPTEMMTDVFRGQSKYLRRYLGFYHGHFCSPSWEGSILRTLIWLREQDGFVISHTFERASTPDDSIRQTIRYSGLVTYRGNRIYMIENAFSDDGFISETILFPAHRQQVNFLRGMTIGVASRPRLSPYSSPMIWKRIRETVSAREALQACGAYPINSLRIDPAVREFLSVEKRGGLGNSDQVLR
jgi:transcriptional regulator with XRE-family HTH domain